MKGRRGFTLIEIVIALTIVGIVAVIATSNLQLWLTHNSAVGFQRGLLAQCSEARTRAMASNLQHRLRIDFGAETVTLERGNAGTGSTAWTALGGSEVRGSRGAGVQDVTCYPGGTVVSAGSFALVLNPDGQVMKQTNPASAATISAVTQVDIRLIPDNPSDNTMVRVFGWTSKARVL
jgi:prepilin-type N-terminal cleavage/methylation domain-containing protein